MNKQLIALLTTALLATTMYLSTEDDMRTLYEQWKQQQSRKFSGEFEDEYRFEIFKQNYQFIQEENAKGKSYKLGMNSFMTTTDEEFELLYLGGLDNSHVLVDERITLFDFPPVDWTDYLGQIKNQGLCGGCWAFSAVGAFEAYYVIQTAWFMILSEQYLIDCDSQSSGCDGGYAGLAIDYLNKKGAVFEKDYPYVAATQTCKIDKGTVKANGRKTYTTASQAYEAIAAYPISVSAHATNWKFYAGGIFDDCINTSTNHAVLAVGYDAAGNWKIRNSWGPNWGEKGNIWLKSGNTCGVLTRLDQVY